MKSTRLKPASLVFEQQQAQQLYLHRQKNKKKQQQLYVQQQLYLLLCSSTSDAGFSLVDFMKIIFFKFNTSALCLASTSNESIGERRSTCGNQ